VPEVREEGRPRILGAGQRLGVRPQPPEPLEQHRLQQRRLRREVPEHRGDADAGQASDLLGRCRFAAAAEDVLGHLEDARPVRPSVPPSHTGLP
jgi:hypothetical protein